MGVRTVPTLFRHRVGTGDARIITIRTAAGESSRKLAV
jgi:hypothetical protein